MELFFSKDVPQGEYFVLPDEDPLTQWMKLIRAKGAQKGLNLDRIKELHDVSNKPDGFHLVGHGEEPQHERYVLTLRVPPMKSTNPDDTTVNFRDRGFGVDVVEGQVLAEYLCEGPGKDGYNVLGARLPYTSEGQAVSIKGNGNVAVEKEGNLTRFIARIGGVLDNRDLNMLDVFPELTVKGGLNFNTGDVQTLHNINIEGDVSSGFKAISGANIFVKGAVEKGSVLQAKGDVVIGGGVSSGVVIEAGGKVSIKFAQGLSIRAGGDVTIEQYLFDCHLWTAGKLIGQGKGRPDRGAIVGGVFNAVGGMELESVGSRSANTLLAVGVDLDLELEIEANRSEQEQCKLEMQRQIRLLPVNMLDVHWKENMQKLSTEKKLICRQRLQKASELRKEIDHREEIAQLLLKKKAELNGGDSIVVGNMTPDCELRIGDAKCRVVAPTSNVVWKVYKGNLQAESR